MITVKEHIKQLQKLIKKDSKVANFPIIYAIDDEGNAFHKIYNSSTVMEVDDINERFLEPTYDHDSDCEGTNYNCVIIN